MSNPGKLQVQMAEWRRGLHYHPASARLLAEAGCTTHQIAALTGHKTLAEVERYTRAVEQKRLAQVAMTKIA